MLMPIFSNLVAAGGGGSGIQFVGGVTAKNEDNAEFTVSLSGLSGGIDTQPSEGDIVVVLHVMVSNGIRDPGPTTEGYIELAELWGNNTNDTNLSVAYKIMGVSPDLSVTVTSNSFTNSPSVVIVHVWRGVDASTPIDVTSTTATGIDGQNADPPAITPITDGAVILVCAGCADSGDNGAEVYTTGELGNFFPAGAGVGMTRQGAAAVGSHQWTSGEFDPAPLTYTGTISTSGSWAACTLALRPAAN